MAAETYDLVVVGAGLHGLAAAKTYLEVNPVASIAVLEKAASIGGVWSKERLYPGLKTNNQLGTYEYSDFPMQGYDVKEVQHIPGPTVHQYLTDYAKKFGVFAKVQLDSSVQAAEQWGEDGWLLSLLRNGQERHVLARKLIVATGLASEPLRVEMPGMNDFAAPIFHSKDFRSNADILNSARSVTVIGGNKSGWDAAYEFAASGIHVDWVIRKSGHGPVWNAPSHVTPLNIWLEKLVFTRLLTWMSPCVWGDADGYGAVRWFLHQTWFGRRLVDAFWWILQNDVEQLNGYDKHPETQKLKPWSGIFWIGTSLSILNFPSSIFELVRQGKIRIHIEDIDHLSAKHVHLADGKVLDSDALICATGWKTLPSINFLPEGLTERLGLPNASSKPNELERKADSKIFSTFPKLQQQPLLNAHYKPLRGDPEKEQSLNEPFRLYRFVVPADPELMALHNIGFAGMAWSLSQPLIAELQALWLAAYLNGNLKISKTPDEVIWETTLHSQFNKWRCPAGFGSKCADMVFDSLPYFDMLLCDLGLTVHRKGTWFKELTQPYGPEDYNGIVDEWRALHM